MTNDGAEPKRVGGFNLGLNVCTWSDVRGVRGSEGNNGGGGSKGLYNLRKGLRDAIYLIIDRVSPYINISCYQHAHDLVTKNDVDTNRDPIFAIWLPIGESVTSAYTARSAW
jgi:hypothetical protein